MRNPNRGQIRIIEAFLALLIVFSAFTVSSSLPASRSTTGREDLASVGLQTLTILDARGALSEYLDDKNYNGLRETLNTVLPANVCFNLTVYDEHMQELDETISNGGFGSHEIASVQYVSISRNSTLHCYILQLLLAVTR